MYATTQFTRSCPILRISLFELSEFINLVASKSTERSPSLLDLTMRKRTLVSVLFLFSLLFLLPDQGYYHLSHLNSSLYITSLDLITKVSPCMHHRKKATRECGR